MADLNIRENGPLSETPQQKFKIQTMTSLIDFYAANYRAQLPLYINNTKKIVNLLRHRILILTHFLYILNQHLLIHIYRVRK